VQRTVRPIFRQQSTAASKLPTMRARAIAFSGLSSARSNLIVAFGERARARFLAAEVESVVWEVAVVVALRKR